MTTLNENNLNDRDENLSSNWQDDDVRTDQLGENTGDSGMETNPYQKAEYSAGNSFSNSGLNQGPGPGEDDDDDDDDSLIPIEDDDDDDDLLDDDDDDFLNVDEDDDVVPGTDMDADDLDDDDDTQDSSGVNRSTMGDMGSNVSAKNNGRTTGRMIDHEPGTGGI